MRHEQNDEKKPFVRLGLAGAHCVCHVAPICKPVLFSFSGCQLPAKRNLFVFVQRVVLLSLGAHRTGAGAALHAGDFGTDGAVDSAALNQVFH